MNAMAYLDLPRVRQAQGVMALPGSKSISNRVLLLSAIAEGTTVITGLLDSDDTRVMLAALRQLVSTARWAATGSPAAMARTIASCSRTEVGSSSASALI